MKQPYTAIFRYRDNDRLRFHAVLIDAESKNKAKNIAKGLEGGDRTTWFDSIETGNPYLLQRDKCLEGISEDTHA